MRTFLISLLLLSVVSISYAETQKVVPVTTGFNHVGLTVSDLRASTDFFVKALGWSIRGEDASYPANFITDGNMLVTLWQTTDPKKVVTFDRKNNVGLHHLAISVASFNALDELYLRLKSFPGVIVEFAPELAYGGPSKHMMIREPSGNRLEFRFDPK